MTHSEAIFMLHYLKAADIGFPGHVAVTAAKLLPNISSAWAISTSETMSGGMNRMVSRQP